jgi:hypothetical protein
MVTVVDMYGRVVQVDGLPSRHVGVVESKSRGEKLFRSEGGGENFSRVENLSRVELKTLVEV